MADLAPPPRRPGVDVVCIASWNVDLVSRVPRPLARGETLLASTFGISPGGKGSNAAVAAARQGAHVALVARIGDDDFGAMGRRLWQVEGIDDQHVEIAAGERSGVAQIMVYGDGDNSIAVCPGAGAALGVNQVQAARATLATCKVVMASCEVPLAATQAAFAIAHPAGAITVLNPAPACQLPAALLALVDVLTPNESELHALAGTAPDSDVDEAARLMLSRGPTAVLVTLGAAGCRLYRTTHAPVQLVGRAVQVRDTIGAGDTFTGALAAALARGVALDEAARHANAAAALSVTGEGAIGAMPSLRQVLDFL